MAEGSRDLGGVATSDPEEDSPNMIVYRKVSLILCVCYMHQYEGKNWHWQAVIRRQPPDSPLVCISCTCQEDFR